MPLGFTIYIACWMTASLVALTLAIARRKSIELFSASYWSSQLQTWKIITFSIAALGMIVIAPYTGDPTWDYFDAGLMSLLTYATAPWAIGVIFRSIRFRCDWAKLTVALCAWMFSASWCYDGYMVLKLGHYPATWLANIFASSVLYTCAGLFWNLQWREGRGVHFGFSETEWPQSGAAVKVHRLLLVGLPFAAIVAIMILAFLF